MASPSILSTNKLFCAVNYVCNTKQSFKIAMELDTDILKNSSVVNLGVACNDKAVASPNKKFQGNDKSLDE